MIAAVAYPVVYAEVNTGSSYKPIFLRAARAMSETAARHHRVQFQLHCLHEGCHILARDCQRNRRSYSNLGKSGRVLAYSDCIQFERLAFLSDSSRANLQAAYYEFARAWQLLLLLQCPSFHDRVVERSTSKWYRLRIRIAFSPPNHVSQGNYNQESGDNRYYEVVKGRRTRIDLN